MSGSWTGAWYRIGERDPAGAVRCKFERVGPLTWQVRLEAGDQVEAMYELLVRGKKEGARVVFRDRIDLGLASGGVYEWTGEIDGQVFQGTFSHPSGDGRFELVRRIDPASIVPPE